MLACFQVQVDAFCVGAPSLAGFSRQAGLIQAQSVMDKFVLLTCLDHSSSAWTDKVLIVIATFENILIFIKQFF